jgi:hypothetical protein
MGCDFAVLRSTYPRIHVVRLPKNRDQSAGLNEGYALAAGELIANLDCDDRFHPDKLRRQRVFLDSHPAVGICGTYIDEIDATGNEVPADSRRYAPWFNGNFDLNDPASWIWQNRMCFSSSMVRRQLREHVGPYDEALLYAPDWNFWTRALVASVQYHILAEPLTQYRAHDTNKTNLEPATRVRDYARFCGTIWHPYLKRIGRDDLIVKSIESLLQQPSVEQASWENTGLLPRLALGSAPHPPVDFSTPNKASDREVLTRVLVDLVAQRRWHDEQRQIWEHKAQQLEHAPSARMLMRASRQLALPIGSWRYALYRKARYALDRG